MIDKNKISDILKNSGADDETARQVNDFVKNMKPSDLEMLNQLLSDENATKQILNSPKAQGLIKKFSNKKM